MVVLEGIGPEVEPNEGEGIGGMVRVLQFQEAVETVELVVELDINGVIGFLLPIGGLTAGGNANTGY
jgi:hypothetical protein